MFAVIHPSSPVPSVGMLPVAGRPLVTRQLQWLRAAGCERVAVALGRDGAELRRWLSEHDALGRAVTLVDVGLPCDARAVARAAGFPADAPLLALPDDVLPFCDPARLFAAPGTASLLAALAPPAALVGLLSGGVIGVLAPDDDRPTTVRLLGEAVRIASLAEAMAVGFAALSHALPPLAGAGSAPFPVHAAEVAPGVWLARGAVIQRGAFIEAPVLLGPGAMVRAGARVGPRVCLGERAVVEAAVALRDALVQRGTIIGEELTAEHVVLGPSGIVDFRTGARLRVDDPLVLASRDPARPTRAPRRVSVTLVVAVTCGLLWTLLVQAGPREAAPSARADVAVAR